MATVKAFKGMRFSCEDLNSKVTPPYDIISPAEQAEFYEKDPYNVIRLEYGVINETDTDLDNRYQRAAKDLNKWLEEGVLKIEESPCFYVYEEVFSLADGTKKSIKGLISRVMLQEFSDNVVLPHEQTLSKAKEDRFNLMSTTFANFSQIYSLYMDKEHIIPSLMEKAPKIKLADFTDDYGIVQRLWKIEDKEYIAEIEKAFKDKQLFIADGHHRYETGLRFKNAHPECEEAKDIMMFLIDLENDGLVIFPTHRIVFDLDVDVNEIIKNAEAFDVTECKKGEGNIEDAKMPSFVMVTPDKDYVLTLKSYDYILKAIPEGSEAYRTLDVNVLHTLLLEPLGIDKENMAAQKNLRYTRDEKEAREEVAKGNANLAFLMNATRVDQIRDVSLAGEKMPQKSTYFYPKLTTGLVMNKF
ncbi:MAG: DUF1015 domain-containing protein [Clostridia bacterium]|nr:DUF1015 domain-containing protein [Clostridia bacterium]